MAVVGTGAVESFRFPKLEVHLGMPVGWYATPGSIFDSVWKGGVGGLVAQISYVLVNA